MVMVQGVAAGACMVPASGGQEVAAAEPATAQALQDWLAAGQATVELAKCLKRVPALLVEQLAELGLGRAELRLVARTRYAYGGARMQMLPKVQGTVGSCRLVFDL